MKKNCAHKSFYKFVKPSSISKLPMFIFYLYFFCLFYDGNIYQYIWTFI